MKQVILLLVGLVMSQTLNSQNEEHIDWNADLDYLAKELSAKHYDYFTIKSKDHFLSGLNAIKQKSEKLNDFQIALKTEQLIAEFGDSHTELNFTRFIDKSQLLPIHLLWASDGLHVLHTTTENKDLLGCKVLAINKVPITTVIDSLNTIYVADNQGIVKCKAPQYMLSLQVLEYFGFVKNGQVELTLDHNKTYMLKPAILDRANRVSFKPDSFAFSMKNERTFFTDSYYPKEKIYHILYNKCFSKELEEQYGDKEKAKALPSFKAFEDSVFNKLKSKPIHKIIFDMRFNGGGNSAQGTAFIEKLAKYLEANPNIKTYVVLGRKTFSSAILNAMDFKRLTNAVFVGEETAGKPNHFGEVRSFWLPSSKLSVSYSTKYFKITDENVNTITPDVPIEMSFSDLAKGIDPVYEWVKKQ